MKMCGKIKKSNFKTLKLVIFLYGKHSKLSKVKTLEKLLFQLVIYGAMILFLKIGLKTI